MNNNGSKDIAIIGMACVLPGAPDVARYWENILHKVNAISDAPPEWEAELFYEENTKADDRTYCKRGGFLGKLAQFDPFTFGIMPNAVDGGEPDHYMALQASHDALKDCGALDLEAVKQRTAVIIGRGTYVNRGNAAALQQGVMVEAILRILKQLHPEHSDEELAEIKKRIQSTLPPFNADTSSGLVPNIITGRIANRLDLMGPNYLIDAACASSLVAVEMAARELQYGNCDLALAGGVNSNTSPVLMMIFSQLGALSHRGQLSSFDKDADGTLLGEGVGMVVLKRLAEAERDGNHIYAVLKNIWHCQRRAGYACTRAAPGRGRTGFAPGLRAGGYRSAYGGSGRSAWHRHAGRRRGGSGGAAARISAAPDGITALRAGLGEVHDQPHRTGCRRGGPHQGGAGFTS